MLATGEIEISNTECFEQVRYDFRCKNCLAVSFMTILNNDVTCHAGNRLEPIDRYLLVALAVNGGNSAIVISGTNKEVQV